MNFLSPGFMPQVARARVHELAAATGVGPRVPTQGRQEDSFEHSVRESVRGSIEHLNAVIDSDLIDGTSTVERAVVQAVLNRRSKLDVFV